VPGSVIYHKTASTLSPKKYIKMFLNHRNSLYIMLKNYPIIALLKYLSIRILLDISALFYFILKCDLKRTLAIIAGYLSCIGEISGIMKKRRQLAAYFPDYYSKVYPKQFQGSIAVNYYLLRKHRYSDLNYSIMEIN
jgi:hypothetical protein